MSGSNYHISYLQILETERRLSLSNILKIFASQQDFGIYSIQTFIKSYSSLDTNNGGKMDGQLVLDEINDLTSIECSLQTVQSLAFIVGYGVHKYMKITQSCHVCVDLLTIDKYFIFDEDSQPDFRFLELTDRSGLKYPSEFIL